MRSRLLAFAVLLTSLAIPALALAQTTGGITGTIRDASGGVLSGVTVTVTGRSLQRQNLSTVTDADGFYRIPLLPPGVYQVTAEVAGFATQTRADIDVALNQTSTVDFQLNVAGVTETVRVTSEVSLVDVARSDVSNRVTNQTIEALPLNGRDFVDLIGLVPGAKPEPSSTQNANVQIFGERAGAISFLFDGAENNDPVTGGPQLRFTQDSIREFEVMTTGYEAQFGRAQGGVANIITRSGTNDLDGRAFWFLRDDQFDASNVPDQDPPTLNRDQWGGTLGGPVVRNRAFFFGSLEKLDERRGVNIQQSRIPAFVRAGLTTPGGAEDFDIAPETDGFTGLGKIDVNLNPNHRFSATINTSQEDVTGEISSPVAGTTALPSAARTQARDGTSAVFRHTGVFTQSTFLESTGTWIDGLSGNNLDATTRAEPILTLLASGFMQTAAPFGGKVRRDTERVQFAQALTHYRAGWAGNHQFKIGWDVNRVGLEGSDEVTNDVEYSAVFLSPNAHAINEDLFSRLGFAQSAARFFTLSANPDGSLDIDINSSDFSAFAQDAWQPRPDLTINYGLRYDHSSLFGDDANNLAPRLGFAWDVGERHTTVVKGHFGIFYDRNLLTAAATVPEKGGVFTRSSFDVALPRLGADYTDSLIDLVITSGFPAAGGARGPAENPAYSAFAAALRSDPLAIYELLGIPVGNPSQPNVVTADNVQQLSGRTPEQVIALLESTWPGTDWEFFDVPGGSIVGDRVLSFFPRGPLSLSRDRSVYSEDRTPWTRAFSAGVDQSLAGDFSVSATYVHRRTRDLLTRRITNLFDVAPGDPNFGATTDGGPRLSEVTYDGRIDYDGVILALRKRYTGRYQFTISYTGSRARDNLLTGQVGSGFSNNNHPEIDLGPSNQSVPHIFVANGLVTLPLDINVSGIAFWRSGNAFNPRGIRDLDGDGLVDQRDTTEERNAFRVDSYANVDLRVEKRFRFLAHHTIGVLVEAFNLFNRANVASVTDVAGAQFGTPVSFFPGREVQFGIRYLFGQ
jgi:Carboxypeptidase regulatory-like domain/TonB dependent receptor/TonB-dependent Receptor Plug Domain